MATVIRKRKLVNPARRKLSPKQIRYFGTPAQKAALRRSRAAKRAVSARGTKPAAKASVKRSSAQRPRHNVSAIITAGLPLGNPHQRKQTTMAAKTKTRRRSNASQTTRRRTNSKSKKRTNPSTSHRPRTKVITKYRYRAKARRGKGKRHNPSRGGNSNLLVNSIAGAAGAVGSRVLPQLFLRTENKGPLGYLANAGAGLGLAWATRKFFSRSAASYVLVGSGIALVLRILQDVTPWGQKLSLLGDTGMGALLPTSFLDPALYVPGRGAERVIPAAFRPPVTAAAPAPMGRMGVAR